MFRKCAWLVAVTTLAACGEASEGQAATTVLALPSSPTASQPSSHVESLFRTVGELTARAVAEENAISVRETTARGEPASDAYVYHADDIRIDRGDFDTDGDDDAVVTIYTCEQSNCHSSTRATRIAHLILTSGAYRLGYYERHTLRAEITDLWGVEGIEIQVTDYGPNDPGCCPSQIIKRIIPIRRAP